MCFQRYILLMLFILFSPWANSTNEQSLPIPASKVTHTTLDNFYQIDTDLYRSGQPDKAQMKELEQRGFKSVLNLRNFHTDNQEAMGTNLKLYHVPMEAGRFTEQHIVTALRDIKNAPKPVLVHCWHGSDRTGVVVAMYRLIFQGWERDAAIAELKKPEFGYHQWAYYNIVQYLEKVDIESVRKQVMASAERD
ncbi:dual specificity protein phosphatase family protein [Pragia fontium]|uniref:dual specificity protein phosphatase family protein n=1 Tax=Pragia fontium TaxID=82985 RepID=UPI00064B26D3|nr:dual specificity protein phosphatase family protein [Pragia fontium]AKJ40907.1 hypothetical protein QQ39_01440 [Pragia fontium]